MKTVPFLICLSFFFLLACQHNKSRTADINSLFSLPEILSEVSGIVATDSLIWMIEDSGNKAVIYGLRSDGEITKTIELNHLNNLDWEDLTRDKEKNLYIGDFGNNNNDRKDLVIYKISTEKSINSIEKINFYYPEQTDFPAKKSEKLFPGQAVQVSPAKDHDIQVKSKSQPIPVKLSCHDWNQIPPHVITQLANVYQISKIQLVERIRKS